MRRISALAVEFSAMRSYGRHRGVLVAFLSPEVLLWTIF
jgi:hypothetical protein